MGRDLTPFILQATTPNAEGVLVLDRPRVCADVMLSSGTVLRLATAALSVSSRSVLAIVGSNTAAVSQAVAPALSYAAKIQSVADIRFAKGSAPSGGGLTLVNLDYAYTQIIGSITSVLDGSTIVLYIAFRKSDGTYEIEPLLSGILQDADGDTTQCTVSVVSDMSQSTAVVAGRDVTQLCAAEFGDARCGHTAHAPGDVCSKIKEDAVAGCRFWRWEFRFYGAPASMETDPSLTQGTGALDRRRSGGWDADGYPTTPTRMDPGHYPTIRD